MKKERFLSDLQDELEQELSEELKSASEKNLLSLKILNAYRAVKRKRNYQQHHDPDYIDTDMERMYDIVKELALYDYNTVGAEGETNHSENSISRTWRSRDEILRQVIPFVQVL